MRKKTILITGSSSGIGLDTALALQKRGHKVIASCRKQEDLDQLNALGLESVLLDVNDSSSIQNAVAEVLVKTSGCLDVLINNAGYGQGGALEDVSRDAFRKQFETNVFGLMELTNLVIPVMRRQGFGRIINVSSILGVISLPFRGAYNASKYAVEGLSDTLRLELKSSGIRVISLEPGAIKSRFRENSIENSLKSIDMQNSYFKQQYAAMLLRYKESKTTSFFTQKTDVIIKKFIHAIEAKNPRPKYPVTFPAHLFIVLKRILSTRMLDKILAAASRKEL